jgi:hypothetical protein
MGPRYVLDEKSPAEMRKDRDYNEATKAMSWWIMYLLARVDGYRTYQSKRQHTLMSVSQREDMMGTR